MTYSQEQPDRLQWQEMECQQQQYITTTTMLVAATVASLAGAGIAAYSSAQQGANAEKVAEYNAAVQKQQSDLQARMSIRQAQINQSMIATQRNQTVAVQQQAEARTTQAAEDIRRNRETQLRFQATQRAGYAKSGVLLSGSPLAVLADTAGIFELQNQDIAYKADSEARALHRQAQLADYGLASDASVERLNEAAARAGQRIGASQSSLIRSQGASAAQGYRYQAVGSLLSGVNSAASGYSRIAAVS